jgi:hypothetical protein
MDQGNLRIARPAQGWISSWGRVALPAGAVEKGAVAPFPTVLAVPNRRAHVEVVELVQAGGVRVPLDLSHRLLVRPIPSLSRLDRVHAHPLRPFEEGPLALRQSVDFHHCSMWLETSALGPLSGALRLYSLMKPFFTASL